MTSIERMWVMSSIDSDRVKGVTWGCHKNIHWIARGYISVWGGCGCGCGCEVEGGFI